MYVITLIIEYEEKIVIEESVAYKEEVIAKAKVVAKKKADDRFNKKVRAAFKDNSTTKVVKTVGEVILAQEPPTPVVSKEEMTNVLDEYEKEVEAL